MSDKAEVILFNDKEIAVYDEFRAQLTELEKWNNTAVFDYEDPVGNKEARSHIYKLRKTKSAVDQARKDTGKQALEYKRKVDGEGNEIIAKIEEMIEVHKKPLDEIEQREKDRVAAHQSSMDCLQRYFDHDFAGEGVDTILHHIDSLSQFEPDESFEEFTAPALSLFKQAMEKAEQALSARKKYEAEQAELERLRAEQAERERKEREERIAKEAAEKAKAEAEAKAKADAEAAERKAQEEREQAAKREAEAKAATERAEQARIAAEENAKLEAIRQAEALKAAEEKAKQDAIDAERRQAEAVKAAEEKARRDAEEAKRKEEEETRKREANKKHKAAINNAALDAIVAIGVKEDLAKSVVEAIAKGLIPNVKINY